MFSDFILVEPFLFQIDLVVIISTRRPELALLNTFSPLMQNVYIHVRAFPLKNHKGSNSKPWFWILILKFVQFFLSYRFDRRFSLWKNELFSLYIHVCVFIEIRHKDQHEFYFKTSRRDGFTCFLINYISILAQLASSDNSTPK